MEELAKDQVENLAIKSKPSRMLSFRTAQLLASIPLYQTNFRQQDNGKDEKHHIYITNIQRDILNAKNIAKLYGTRCDIELLFKELKSKYSLDILETNNVQLIEALIWTTMLTLIVSIRIHLW